MKAQLRHDHVVMGVYEGFSLSRLAEWLFIWPVAVTFTALAVMWYKAQREKGLVEKSIGNFTLTLDGGE